jgi:hypothetical protein
VISDAHLGLKAAAAKMLKAAWPTGSAWRRVSPGRTWRARMITAAPNIMDSAIIASNRRARHRHEAQRRGIQCQAVRQSERGDGCVACAGLLSPANLRTFSQIGFVCVDDDFVADGFRPSRHVLTRTANPDFHAA